MATIDVKYLGLGTEVLEVLETFGVPEGRQGECCFALLKLVEGRGSVEGADRYRFDDSYGSVYEYDRGYSSYVFRCSYLSAGISCRNRESTKIKKMRAWELGASDA